MKALRSDAGVTMSRGRMCRSVIVTQAVDQFRREVARRRGSSEAGEPYEWLEAEDRDERLHGVVGEHAAAAALAGQACRAYRVRTLSGLIGHLER